MHYFSIKQIIFSPNSHNKTNRLILLVLLHINKIKIKIKLGYFNIFIEIEYGIDFK